MSRWTPVAGAALGVGIVGLLGFTVAMRDTGVERPSYVQVQELDGVPTAAAPIRHQSLYGAASPVKSGATATVRPAIASADHFSESGESTKRSERSHSHKRRKRGGIAVKTKEIQKSMGGGTDTPRLVVTDDSLSSREAPGFEVAPPPVKAAATHPSRPENPPAPDSRDEPTTWERTDSSPGVSSSADTWERIEVRETRRSRRSSRKASEDEQRPERGPQEESQDSSIDESDSNP